MAPDNKDGATDQRKAEFKMPGFNREEEEDDLFDRVSDMADRMGLQGDKRAVYIDDHMEQGGYERVQTRESYARIRQNEDDEDPQERGRGKSRWFGTDDPERDDRGRGGSGRGSRRATVGGRGMRDDQDSF